MTCIENDQLKHSIMKRKVILRCGYSEMTITTYYITFGFKVKISSLMKIKGYTLEKLTEQTRLECEEYLHEPTDDSTVEEWFREEYLGGGYAGRRELEIDGVKFIIRGFTHDKEAYDEYVVVGVDLGTVEDFGGMLASTNRNAKADLCRLVKNPDWAKLIQECEDHNAMFHDMIDYGAPSLKYKGSCVEPQIFFTSNDCGCCS